MSWISRPTRDPILFGLELSLNGCAKLFSVCVQKVVVNDCSGFSTISAAVSTVVSASFERALRKNVAQFGPHYWTSFDKGFAKGWKLRSKLVDCPE